MQWQLIWKKDAKLSQLSTLINNIQQSLRKNDVFCLWLEGNLGAGKTTLTRELLYNLGLDRHTSVNSPSYTYLLEYEINKKWYAHLDFYRMNQIDIAENDSLFGLREYSGLVVEWPQNSTSLEKIQPTHLLNITTNCDRTSRLYSFYEKK